MITKHFAIYDIQSEHYASVFAAPTLGAAERMFRDSVNKPDSPHAAHPNDYRLYYMYDLDDETGLVKQEQTQPFLVCEGLSLVN